MKEELAELIHFFGYAKSEANQESMFDYSDSPVEKYNELSNKYLELNKNSWKYMLENKS